MELAGAHCVVTGAAQGIGAAVARRLAAAGARAVVVADLDGDGAEGVAREIAGRTSGGAAAEPVGTGATECLGLRVDVGRAEEIDRLVSSAEQRFGPIDLFCSNAGIAGPHGGPEVADGEWQRTWEINVMSHVWAARRLLPGMLARRHGHLNSTASAAGLLANPGLMPYSVSKHAAVAVAEWLAITYGRGTGVTFSCFCPQGVATPMLETWREEDPAARLAAKSGETISPEAAAEALLAGLTADRFLILSHAEVSTYMERKAADPERWLGGMQRFQAEIDRARAEG
ncbi:MAG TPA: SDR family oxidoreductase [Solirubrobacterales bacterium]|jgi:NAD(P)-dependent dehydrogenase (short-subunit alcohol dehydrogenase family)|nr:SDR family oxidoreductase [Solirubrobacterales bacterium]